MKPQSAKAKGRTLQKVVRNAILEAFTDLTDRDVRSTSMGASGVDVLLSEVAIRRFPYSVECKSRARMAIYDLWMDTLDNVAPDTNPLLVVKMNHQPPLAVVSLEHFMALVKELNESKKIV